MKTCKNGHENADDADRCVVCWQMLPGNKMGTRFGTTQHAPTPPEIREGKAQKWAEDAGVVWDDMQQIHKDYLIRCQGANTSSAMWDGAQNILGLYKPKPKPKAFEKEEAEALVVEITAESVESLSRSLKLLERLSRGSN